jgi:tRNA-splicing ligase RtcB
MVCGKPILYLIFSKRDAVSKPIRKEDLIKINEYTYEISDAFRSDMRVPARVFTHASMLPSIEQDRALEQLVNVATLPGIQKYAFAMPDIHQGYGFPIGGVAAMAIADGGVISPGGIGYDINCGVRVLTVSASYDELKPYLEELATALFDNIPSGVGRSGTLSLDSHDLDKVLQHGAHRMVEIGYGNEEDLLFCEEHGRMDIADPGLVSKEAKKRGKDQLGTLGSGNHFLEIQKVVEVYDEHIASVFGIKKDMVTVMIHCGSRGLGHQTCTDYVRRMVGALPQWNIQLPDRELVCAPFTSDVAQEYYAAMAAAANFAWANRHTIGHWTRKVFQNVVGDSITLKTLYDVSHNIGKREKHTIYGKDVDVIMHRKGATRAFGAGSIETPEQYRSVGQPVLIPGTMGTSSFILVGTTGSMDVAFGSSCHGAGRSMSRTQAQKKVSGFELRKQLESRGIIVRCDSNKGLAEEAPFAYKDVQSVVDTVQGAGLAHKVARVEPIAVVKGG